MTLLCEDLSELYSHFNEYRLNEKFCDVVVLLELENVLSRAIA